MPLIKNLQPVTTVTDAMRIAVASVAGNLDVDQAVLMSAVLTYLQAADDLRYLLLSGGTITGDVTIADVNVVLGTTTGTKIGTAASQKLAFFNATPIVQPAAAAQGACPAGGTGASGGAWDTSGNRDTAIATINAMRTALINLGIIKGAA
jgi:hypothetical protein